MMTPKIHHDDAPVFGRQSHAATVQIGALGMGGYGENKQAALRDLLERARSYREAINRTVEAIEEEIKVAEADERAFKIAADVFG